MAAPSRITWRHSEPVEAVCPVCHDGESKLARLQVMALNEPDQSITLVECTACSVRFFPSLPPGSFADVDDLVASTQFELAIGLRGSIDCLPRIDTAAVRRFLEVGCGTGLTLDFARHVYGWEVLGVDTSAMARLAPQELGVPIVPAFLGETDEVPARAWDVVFACEVIEHVTDPAEFLRAIRAALAPGATFLLRTPAAEGLDRSRPEEPLMATLSPGYHTMIHTSASLERCLRQAGFEQVRVLRDGDTLHAAASDAPFDWHVDAVIPPEQLEQYLRERASGLSAGAATRLGLLQQLLNHLVNRGDAPGARWASEELDRALIARHGVGIDAEPTAIATFDALTYCAAFIAKAMLLRLEGNRAAAESRFAAAAELARRALEEVDTRTGLDLAFRPSLRLAERERLSLVALRDPREAASLLETLVGDDPASRAKLVLDVFVASMSTGTYDVASPLAREVRTHLAATPQAERAHEAHWALGMLALNHDLERNEAARQFRASAASARTSEQRWGARFHEAYALWLAGSRDEAMPLLQQVTDAGGAAGPWVDRARALLAQA
jgi:SAM-dependent methyltransferase